MKTILVTLDEDLLAEVDEAVHALNTARSTFMRAALQLALRQRKNEKLERQHAAGYTHYPVKPAEFDSWEAEQFWGQE